MDHNGSASIATCISRRAALRLAWRIPATAGLYWLMPTAAGASDADIKQKVPACALSISNMPPARLETFHGMVIYLDFWASWCAPCLLSFPFMNRLNASFRDQGLKIIAVNMDEHQADAQRFLAQHPSSFDIANGPNEQCAKSFAVAEMPSSFVIDRNGFVRMRHQGFRAGDEEPLRSQIGRLLSETTQL